MSRTGDSRARCRISSEYALPIPLRMRGSVSVRLSVCRSRSTALRKLATSARRGSMPPGSSAASAGSPLHHVQGGALLRARLGEEQGARCEVEGREPELAGELGPRRTPAQAAGDHEMQHHEALAVQREDDALPDPSQRRPRGRRRRRSAAARRCAAGTGCAAARARAAGRRCAAAAPRCRPRRRAARASTRPRD